MYKVQFSEDAQKAIKRLDTVSQRRVVEKMKYLEKLPNPRCGPNIKTMQGFVGRYRFRIGSLRVIYEIYDKELIILVIDVGERGNIYR
jgi:mRNA interferase RelE/StbE